MTSSKELRILEKLLHARAVLLTDGQERFSLVVNADSDKSYWSHKALKIQIGQKGIDRKQFHSLGELLVEHEVGHVKFTSRTLEAKRMGFPFPILNILEDARIEKKMERDFGPLHLNDYEQCYLNDSEDVDRFANPYNMGVLLRWRRWGVRTTTERPEALDEAGYREFLADWESALDRSATAFSTAEVKLYAEDLYRKWQWLFDQYESEGAPLGGIEGDAESLTGEKEEQEAGTHGTEEQCPAMEDSPHFGVKWFDWEMSYINAQVQALRKMLKVKSVTDCVFSLSGHRFDPRRIDNPPLAPFRTNVERFSAFHLKHLLLVIDGSGSMQGQPFRDAAHVAYILSEVFPVVIKITTSKSSTPLEVPVERRGVLRHFNGWGGSENYRSLQNTPAQYSFTLFLTDANVDIRDLDYVRNVLSKITMVGAGYVGRGGTRLSEVFPKNFCSVVLDRGIAGMFARFLRRHFTRYLAA